MSCGRSEAFPEKERMGRQTSRSRKGFGYDVRKARKRTRNAAVRDLVGGGVFAGAVLEVLGSTGVGTRYQGGDGP